MVNRLPDYGTSFAGKASTDDMFFAWEAAIGTAVFAIRM